MSVPVLIEQLGVLNEVLIRGLNPQQSSITLRGLANQPNCTPYSFRGFLYSWSGFPVSSSPPSNNHLGNQPRVCPIAFGFLHSWRGRSILPAPPPTTIQDLRIGVRDYSRLSVGIRSAPVEQIGIREYTRLS